MSIGSPAPPPSRGSRVRPSAIGVLRAGAFRPSELTAQRPTGRSTPSVIHRQGISHCHVSDSDRIVSVLSIDAERETAEVALYYCVLTTTQQKGSRASRPLSAFPFTPFCQTAVHSRIGVGLPAQRPPPPLTSNRRRSDDLRIATASGAGACYRASGLILNPQLSDHTLDSRTVSFAAATSTEQWPFPTSGGSGCFPRIVFFAMKHLGSAPRSIFPSAKVGLTAHRKTGPPGFAA